MHEGLKPAERAAAVTLSLVAFLTAILVDSPAGLLIVGIPLVAMCAAIAVNIAGFGERAWITSTRAASRRRGLGLRLFRVIIGGVGGLIGLAGFLGGLVLLLR